MTRIARRFGVFSHSLSVIGSHHLPYTKDQEQTQAKQYHRIGRVQRG
jgi:hypothetical protein